MRSIHSTLEPIRPLKAVAGVALILAIIASAVLPLLLPVRVSAQVGGVKWEDPINLSNSLPSSTYPAIVADRFGFLHVFWAEDVGGEAVDPEFPLEASNAIVYTVWNGITWSEPIDVFYTTDGGGYNYPYVAIDQNDVLYLTWQSYSGIYFSSVPIAQASDVKAWKAPQVVARYRGDGPRLTVDSQGGLHLIFTGWQNAELEKKDGNVYYLNSFDEGHTWFGPVQLSEIPFEAAIQIGYPSLVIDSEQKIHVVWSQNEPPEWNGSSIHYTRSEDGGETWLRPAELFRRSGVETWASKPELINNADKELHLTWICGEYAYRCHRWSQDGGQTWSVTERVFGNMLALAGNDTLVQDSSGTLYWILQLRYPYAIYYSFWTGQRWSDLQIVNDGILAEGHHVRAQITQGNQIGLVVVHQKSKEIWFLDGITNAETIPPQPTPLITPTPGTTPTPVLTPPTPTPPLVGPIPLDAPPVSGSVSPNNLLFIGIIPVVGILAFTIFTRAWKTRRM